MKSTKVFLLLLIVLLGSNLLSIQNQVKTSSKLNFVATEAKKRFSSDVLEFLYQSQMQMVGNYVYDTPEAYKHSILTGLDVIINSNKEETGVTLRDIMTRRTWDYKFFDSLNSDEFISQLAGSYPISMAYYQSGFNKIQNERELNRAFSNFESSYLKATQVLRQYHEKHKSYKGMKITVKSLDNKIIYRGNTEDFISLERRNGLVSKLRSSMKGKDSIADSVWVIELEQ